MNKLIYIFKPFIAIGLAPVVFVITFLLLLQVTSGIAPMTALQWSNLFGQVWAIPFIITLGITIYRLIKTLLGK